MKPKEINEHTSITYLKSEQISKVLSDGFALLYHNKPQFPVTYLAHYLLNYSKSKTDQHKLTDVVSKKRSIIEGFHHKQQQKKQSQHQLEQSLKDHKHKLEQFDEYVKNHPVHGQVLNEVCEELERRYKLGGVYVGEVKHPKRVFTEMEEGENVHLELEQPKRIEYTAYSKSQEKIMSGKYLSLESITGGIFQQKQAQQGGEGGEDDKKQKQKNYVYIPEVIKNEKMVYFRLPKLGAYMAVPMVCKSYLGENLFETGLEETMKYQKAVEELEKEREKKENQFREQYDEKQRNGAEEKELQEMEKKYEEEKAAIPDPPAPVLPSIQRQFVLCFDTLGKECEIPQETQKQLETYVEFLKKSWQDKELSYLQSDIDNQIKNLQSLDAPIADLLPKLAEQQQKQLTPELQQLSKYKSNEKQYNFQLDSVRLQKIKQQFQDERYQQSYNTLRTMNILRYPGIMQSVLYFLGYQKKQVNIPNTNLLDWRKVRELLAKDKIIQKLCQYTHRGYKQQQVKGYSKWNKLLPNLQKYELNTVLSYNLFYGKLLKYMVMTGKLRKVDCQLRAEKIEQLKKAREERIVENQKVEAERERVREEQRAAVAGKEDQVFDEEAWELQYNEEHPLQEVGEEVENQVDRDFDVEEKEVQPPA